MLSNEILTKAFKNEAKSTAKMNRIEDEKKPREKRKKSIKKNEDEL